jgi:hypothetical protein
MSKDKIQIFKPNPAQNMAQLTPQQQAARTQAAMNIMQSNHQQAMLAQQPQRQVNSALPTWGQQSAYNISRDAWIDQRYMIDGNYMSLQQFVDFIWPEDCVDKTFFILKHTKETQ